MATRKKPVSSPATTVLNKPSFNIMIDMMRRRLDLMACLFLFLSLFIFLCVSFYASQTDLNFILYRKTLPNSSINVIQPQQKELTRPTPRVSSLHFVDSVSILLPDWEVLMIVSPGIKVADSVGESFWCAYANKAISPASFVGILPLPNRTAFKCAFPESARRRKKLLQPILLTRWPEFLKQMTPSLKAAPEIMKWNYLAYESFSTENDVVLFVKGVNNRQGINKSPNEFKCVFGENSVKTAVTSSTQEVFRCRHPDLTVVKYTEQIKISLEFSLVNQVAPSVAYYTPLSTLEKRREKSLLCACTMVHNVAKFLREWVMYGSKIGVDRFILYDNNSDDNLKEVVEELNHEGGYNVEILLWVWPKSQESGFSHAALYAKDSCTWMTYVDVDEFIFSPSWNRLDQPSDQLLKSLLPNIINSSSSDTKIGQIVLMCNEFGPSNQTSHPTKGVTQGYTCRRHDYNRHKSIVLLEAINYSLLNAIHHFELKENYRSEKLRMESALVNHYKYQAWPEFKSKFRSRVSAYVVDWTKDANLKSKDRTPGLGIEPIEPEGWAQKFCEVGDERLKSLTQKWFADQTSNRLKMAWET